jgi:hypothetical protein
MKKTTNNALRIAVLAALAGTSVGAYAASSPVASELETTKTIAGIPRSYSATTAFAPSSAQPLQITINLSNNSKFVTAPKVTCTTKATSGSADAAVAASKITPVLSLGGAGATQAVFSSTTASSAQIKSCLVTAASISVTGAHANVVESITFKYGTLASSTVSNTLITWASGVSAQAVTKATVTAKVTAGFNKFNAGQTVVTGGVVKALGVTAGKASTATITKAGNLGTYFNTATITFSGTPLGAAKATAGVFVVAAAAACATGNKLAGTSAKGGASSVSFKLTPTQVSAGVRSCFAYSGTSAIPAGTITAALSFTAKTNMTAPTFTSKDVLEVTRDGSSVSLMNMPRSTDTDQGFLRVYNTSTIAGAITATIYNQSGTALATNCSLSSSLAAGAALVMSAAQVETACGINPANVTGRYRMDIAGAIPSMKAQMFARSGGVLTNVTADK